MTFSPTGGGVVERRRLDTRGPASVTIASGNVGVIGEDAILKFRENGWWLKGYEGARRTGSKCECRARTASISDL